MSIEIITKKINGLFDVKNTKIVMGDIRHMYVDSMIKQCEAVIDRYYRRGYDKLWLLVYAYCEPAERSVIRTKILVLDYLPPKILGTVCIRVDYKLSDVDLEWVLPLDTIKPPGVIDQSDQPAAPRIIEDAGDMPIIH